MTEQSATRKQDQSVQAPGTNGPVWITCDCRTADYDILMAL